jgi:hypothetical protein
MDYTQQFPQVIKLCMPGAAGVAQARNRLQPGQALVSLQDL